MIHIVFQHADVEAIRKSFQLDPSMEGEVVEIMDEYAVGPIKDIFSEEGMLTRLHWWKDILSGGHYEGIADDGHVDDVKTVSDLKQKLNGDKDEVVWIWAAQNKHDVSGYYWLMSQLKDYQGRIYILYLNNLPFINEKGNIFYPTNLFEIQPKEFIKAKKLARQITSSEFEVDPDEWLKLCNEDKGVRLLEGGKKLIQKEYDFYDGELIRYLNTNWQKGSKLMQIYFSKAKETTGDAYLLWRLKTLVEEGKLEFRGDMKSMKEFEVKLPGAEAREVETLEVETA